MLSVWCFLIQGLIQFPVAACAGTSGAGVSLTSVCLITAGSSESADPNSSLIVYEAIFLLAHLVIFYGVMDIPVIVEGTQHLHSPYFNSYGCQKALANKNSGTCTEKGQYQCFSFDTTHFCRHMTLYQLEHHVDWHGLKLTSFNKTLAAFPFVFIVKKYNNLSKWFTAEMVWARTSCVKLNPPLHYGNVRLGVSAKQTEAALIVWCTLMKSATPGLRNEIHAWLFIPYILTQAIFAIGHSSAGFEQKKPHVWSD